MPPQEFAIPCSNVYFIVLPVLKRNTWFVKQKLNKRIRRNYHLLCQRAVKVIIARGIDRWYFKIWPMAIMCNYSLMAHRILVELFQKPGIILNFSYKWPDNEYVRLCGPYSLCCQYTTVPLWHECSHRQYRNGNM